MASTKSHLPSAAALRATVDATGVVNLSALADVCLEALRAIQANGCTERTISRSRGALAKRVRLLLSAHGFDDRTARTWFHDQAVALFRLEQNAEVDA